MSVMNAEYVWVGEGPTRADYLYIERSGIVAWLESPVALVRRCGRQRYEARAIGSARWVSGKTRRQALWRLWEWYGADMRARALVWRAEGWR